MQVPEASFCSDGEKQEKQQRLDDVSLPLRFDHGARGLGPSTAATIGDSHVLCRRRAICAFGVLEGQSAGGGGE